MLIEKDNESRSVKMKVIMMFASAHRPQRCCFCWKSEVFRYYGLKMDAL